MSLKGPTVTFAKQENFQTLLTRSVSSQASWLTIQEHRNLQCTIWLMEGVETTRCLGTTWTGHWRMPSAWLLLLWTSTLPPLPLRTLSLPCKSTSLHPHFHFNFKKIPFPPQTAGSASVSRPWSLSGLLFFWQLTNDTDSLVNSGTLSHTHVNAAQPQVWYICALPPPPPVTNADLSAA